MIMKIIYNGSDKFKKRIVDWLNKKIDEPETEGTDGQVLTTDGNGGRSWTTVDMSNMSNYYTKEEVDGIDGRVTNNTTAIDGLSQDVTSMQGTVDNLSTELDAEKTARETADTGLQSSIDNEVNERISGDNALQQNINNLDDRESEHYSDCTERIDNLDSKVTTNENDIATLNAQVKELKGTGSGLEGNSTGIEGIGAGFHSSIYRGKYLGDTYTDAQKQAIASGTFDDLFIGDYWTINGVNWRIADFDYYYNIGDTNFTKHHIIIVPDTVLYNAQMNSTNSTSGAYTGSKMYTTNLDNARIMFDNAFGSSFIPKHRGKYSNATSGGSPSGWAWRDMRVELMSEEQLYGHVVWGATDHNGYDVCTQKTQFKLFVLDQTKINLRQKYWLTNVKSSDAFVVMSDRGEVDYFKPTNDFGVRPFACLVGDSEQ
jgi:uncharacterized coiled-coil protein SlyX